MAGAQSLAKITNYRRTLGFQRFKIQEVKKFGRNYMYLKTIAFERFWKSIVIQEMMMF